VGKDAVIRRLQEKRPDLHFVVTATSRPMRPGEKDGVDYFFVSKEEFETWIEQGKLLEHAVVYGEYKGIPKFQVEEALANKMDVILRIDVQGAATMRSLLPGMVSIFLVADTVKELVERLTARKTEPPVRLFDFGKTRCVMMYFFFCWWWWWWMAVVLLLILYMYVCGCRKR